MKEIFIKYNPYKVETTVTIDGNPVKKESEFNVEDKRLQEWIESLPEMLQEECNTRSYKIIFHGTELDYEDLLSVVAEAREKGMEIETEHIQAKEIKDKEKAIREIFEEIQNGPFDELRQPDVKKAFELAESEEFPVNVVATMSAGKSTLINSLLRQNMMPAKQEACTATITEIKDNGKEYFSAKAYDQNGRLLEVHPELSLDVMKSLNDNQAVSVIRAEGDIPFVDSEDVALVLVDTPGPNNSRDKTHKEATYRMLSESSKTLVLYILNATQLAVNDDNNLLDDVAESMSVGGKQSKDRFIFVVNKLDDFKKGQDSVEAAIDKTRKYLEDKGIKNPNIYPASALTALDVRTTLRDVRVVGYSEDELDELDDEILGMISKVKKINKNQELHLERYAPLTPSMKGKISAELEKASELAAERNDADICSDGMKQLALIHSGIVPIEEAIKMYVQKYAKTAKIKNIVDTFLKKLESAKSFENTKQEIANNRDKQEKILKQIASIQEKLQDGKSAKKFQEKIDALNYEKEMDMIARKIEKEAFAEIERQTSKITDGTKYTVQTAEKMCEEFAKFAEDLQAKVQIRLEELVTSQMKKNVDELLKQYKERVSRLEGELNTGKLQINPFQMMDGAIEGMANVNELMELAARVESVEVDNKWVKNKDKKWYKPWTWFQESGHYESVYEDQKYIDARALADEYFKQFQGKLLDNSDEVKQYVEKQSRFIKKEFKKKFDELDAVLNNKLKELEIYADNQKDIDNLIKETQRRLKWLENIQGKIQSILEI